MLCATTRGKTGAGRNVTLEEKDCTFLLGRKRGTRKRVRTRRRGRSRSSTQRNANKLHVPRTPRARVLAHDVCVYTNVPASNAMANLRILQHVLPFRTRWGFSPSRVVIHFYVARGSRPLYSLSRLVNPRPFRPVGRSRRFDTPRPSKSSNRSFETSGMSRFDPSLDPHVRRLPREDSFSQLGLQNPTRLKNLRLIQGRFTPATLGVRILSRANKSPKLSFKYKTIPF